MAKVSDLFIDVQFGLYLCMIKVKCCFDHINEMIWYHVCLEKESDL